MPPADRQPFIQLSVNKAKPPPAMAAAKAPISVFPYVSLLVQSFDVKVEESIVWDVIQLFSDFQTTFLVRAFAVELERPVRKRVSDTLRPPNDFHSRYIYFVKLLQLQPIAVNISFLPSPERRVKAAQQTTYNPFKVLLNALGTSVAIADAPVRINGIAVDDARGSWQTLIDPIMQHFKSQALRQAYKVLGSIDLLG